MPISPACWGRGGAEAGWLPWLSGFLTSSKFSERASLKQVRWHYVVEQETQYPFLTSTMCIGAYTYTHMYQNSFNLHAGRKNGLG